MSVFLIPMQLSSSVSCAKGDKNRKASWAFRAFEQIVSLLPPHFSLEPHRKKKTIHLQPLSHISLVSAKKHTTLQLPDTVTIRRGKNILRNVSPRIHCDVAVCHRQQRDIHPLANSRSEWAQSSTSPCEIPPSPHKSDATERHPKKQFVSFELIWWSVHVFSHRSLKIATGADCSRSSNSNTAALTLRRRGTVSVWSGRLCWCSALQSQLQVIE